MALEKGKRELFLRLEGLIPTTSSMPPLHLASREPSPVVLSWGVSSPGQQQDTLQVRVGSYQSPPASCLLHTRNHHSATIPSEQCLQGLHCAAGGGNSRAVGSEGKKGLSHPPLTQVYLLTWHGCEVALGEKAPKL